MECLRVDKIPEGDFWTYELKLDGYRLEAVKTKGRIILYSRRGNDLTKRFDYIAQALQPLPDDTVIDGELVALDEGGRPSFNLLQNFRSAASHIIYYAFDILTHRGEDVKQLPLPKLDAELSGQQSVLEGIRLRKTLVPHSTKDLRRRSVRICSKQPAKDCSRSHFGLSRERGNPRGESVGRSTKVNVSFR